MRRAPALEQSERCLCGRSRREERIMTLERTTDRLALIACSLVALGSWLGAAPCSALCTSSATNCRDGSFTPPFAEPTILGQPTAEKCIQDSNGQLACKPAAGTLALLSDDRVLYFNALEGTEN